MTRREGFWFVRLVWVAAAAIAVMGFVSIVHENRARDETCNRLASIGGDPQRIQYVRNWVAERTGDAEFMEAVRRFRSFEHTNPILRAYIDLDWDYLGLPPNLAWIEFNMKSTETRNVDARGIGSVSLHEGRSSIIIQLNDASDLGLGWPADAMSRLQDVGNGAFCIVSRSRSMLVSSRPVVCVSG